MLRFVALTMISETPRCWTPGQESFWLLLIGVNLLNNAVLVAIQLQRLDALSLETPSQRVVTDVIFPPSFSITYASKLMNTS
jgi:hypothetical protein